VTFELSSSVIKSHLLEGTPIRYLRLAVFAMVGIPAAMLNLSGRIIGESPHKMVCLSGRFEGVPAEYDFPDSGLHRDVVL
jgi:hypothetical protein